MNKLIPISLLFLPLSLCGQVQQTTTKLALELVVAVDFYDADKAYELKELKELYLFSPHAELKLGKYLSENFILLSGLRYSKIAFENLVEISFNFDDSFTIELNENEILQQRGYSFPNTFGQLLIDSEISYLRFDTIADPKNLDIHELSLFSTNVIQQVGIPLELRKRIGNRKLRASIFSSFIPNFVIAKKVDLERFRQSGLQINDFRDTDEISKTSEIRKLTGTLAEDNLNKVTLDFNFGIGMEHIGTHNTFFMEGLYARNLIPISELGNEKKYLQAFGFRTGLRFRFY